jgi:glycosyltransferase involved in cell wall biosynthesis
MIVYIDARCLQDENFAFRGVGYHSYTLLKYAKKYNVRKLIAILDDDLPPLKEKHINLFDSIQTYSTPTEIKQQNESVFLISLSPMTHPQWKLGPLIENSNITSAAILYDFIPLDYENNKVYFPKISQKRAYTTNLLWLKKFDLYSSISSSTAIRAKTLLDLKKENIVVTGCAIRDQFIDNHNNNLSPTNKTSFKPLTYCICVSGSDPRKNPELILESIAEINKMGHDLGLKLVGNINDYLKNQLIKKFGDLGGNINNLEFISGVSDENLKKLYKNALVSISPSKAEGFSIPVIEAIASKCPSIASSIPAHQELLETDALFSIDSPKELTNKILDLLDNPDLIKRMIITQSQLIEKFKEPIVAERFWNLLINNQKNNETRITSITSIGKSKPRIAFLSPFPPDKSGIADYTAKSLEEIGKLAIVDVFTDAIPQKSFPGIRNIFPLSEKPFQSNEYDKVVSIIGNSHYHTEILKYHLQYGGACIQHDNRMAELYAWNMGHEQFAKKASQLTKRNVEIAECQTWLKDPSLLPTLFLEDIIKKSKPLIFHSKVTQKLVKEMYGVDTDYLPFSSYRHFSDNELTHETKLATKKKLNLPLEDIIISTFGLVTETKAPFDCIYATYFLNKWGVPATFYFVGETGALNEPLLNLAENLGIPTKIKSLNSWTSEETYKDFLLASDFAIQLRTYGFGGLSGAILDCISSGLPTVVNEDLAEATNSPKFMLRTNDHISALLMAENIYDEYKEGKFRNRLSVERKEYLEIHNFKKYAEDLIKLLGF